MPIVNFSNVLTVVLAVILLLLVLYIGKNTQRSWLLAGAVLVFLALFVFHVCEATFITNLSTEVRSALNTSVIADCIFVIISFAGYIWLNYLHSKGENKQVLEENSDYYSKKKQKRK